MPDDPGPTHGASILPGAPEFHPTTDALVRVMISEASAHIERLLERSRAGDAAASGELAAALYMELHEIASTLVRGQAAGHTLQATALVHEAWMRVTRSKSERIADRDHFLRVAARAMRCVLVDHARNRSRRKRCAGGTRIPIEALDQIVVAHEERALDLEALDRALERLAQFDERMARAVDLHFFAGLGMKATAEALGMSQRAFQLEWDATKAWLLGEIC